ncbi:MAG: GNAT family N-acetyltransferase, partial [Staphylococcus equorum]|nr:GNAT family N-acetyltransferase [Staphylococcus equorum]
MEHIKTYQSQTYHLDEGTFVIEGPVLRSSLESMTFDDGLFAFRPPTDQFEAIKEISELEEGRIFVLRNSQHIIGYVTYHYPDPLERWSSGNLEYLIELGAIELSLAYRDLHLGSELIKVS